MTPALHRMLTALAAAEDAEDYDNADILVEGRQVYVGCTPFSTRTLNEAFNLLAISDSGEEGKGCRRYKINSTGRLLLRAPDQEAVLLALIQSRTKMTIKDDCFMPLGDAA